MTTSKTWAKRLAQLSAAHAAGKAVWWQRGPFHAEPHRDTQPKWHQFADRTRLAGRPYTARWVAVCGYTRDYDEGILLETPHTRLAAPKRGERCIRCTSD